MLPDKQAFLLAGVAHEYMERRRRQPSWEAKAFAKFFGVKDLEMCVAKVWLVERSGAEDAEKRLGLHLAAEPGFVDVSPHGNLLSSGLQSSVAPWHFTCPDKLRFVQGSFVP